MIVKCLLGEPGQPFDDSCTIANVRRVDVDTLTKNSGREAERWFLAIRKGDVPRSNAVSKITKGWIEEFCEANALVLPKYKLVSSDQFPEIFKAKETLDLVNGFGVKIGEVEI